VAEKKGQNMIRMHGSHRSNAAPLAFNSTPLVDMIFTLAIFFMLVTRFSSAELAPMQLPQPDRSQAEVVRMPTRVIINCRPDQRDRSRVLYSLGPNQPEPLSIISDRLAALKRDTPDVQVVVRADRRLSYADVRAVMRVVASLDIELLNVVAQVSEGD
jgi:biopolymer transport protein ExbD